MDPNLWNNQQYATARLSAGSLPSNLGSLEQHGVATTGIGAMSAPLATHNTLAVTHPSIISAVSQGLPGSAMSQILSAGQLPYMTVPVGQPAYNLVESPSRSVTDMAAVAAASRFAAQSKVSLFNTDPHTMREAAHSPTPVSSPPPVLTTEQVRNWGLSNFIPGTNTAAFSSHADNPNSEHRTTQPQQPPPAHSGHARGSTIQKLQYQSKADYQPTPIPELRPRQAHSNSYSQDTVRSHLLEDMLKSTQPLAQQQQPPVAHSNSSHSSQNTASLHQLDLHSAQRQGYHDSRPHANSNPQYTERQQSITSHPSYTETSPTITSPHGSYTEVAHAHHHQQQQQQQQQAQHQPQQQPQQNPSPISRHLQPTQQVKVIRVSQVPYTPYNTSAQPTYINSSSLDTSNYDPISPPSVTEETPGLSLQDFANISSHQEKIPMSVSSVPGHSVSLLSLQQQAAGLLEDQAPRQESIIMQTLRSPTVTLTSGSSIPPLPIQAVADSTTKPKRGGGRKPGGRTSKTNNNMGRKKKNHITAEEEIAQVNPMAVTHGSTQQTPVYSSPAVITEAYQPHHADSYSTISADHIGLSHITTSSMPVHHIQQNCPEQQPVFMTNTFGNSFTNPKGGVMTEQEPPVKLEEPAHNHLIDSEQDIMFPEVSPKHKQPRTKAEQKQMPSTAVVDDDEFAHLTPAPTKQNPNERKAPGNPHHSPPGNPHGNPHNPHGNPHPAGNPNVHGNPHGKPHGNPQGNPHGDITDNPHGNPNSNPQGNPQDNPQPSGSQSSAEANTAVKPKSKDSSFQSSFLSFLQGKKQETLSSVTNSAITCKPQLPKYIPDTRPLVPRKVPTAPSATKEAPRPDPTQKPEVATPSKPDAVPKAPVAFSDEEGEDTDSMQSNKNLNKAVESVISNLGGEDAQSTEDAKSTETGTTTYMIMSSTPAPTPPPSGRGRPRKTSTQKKEPIGRLKGRGKRTSSVDEPVTPGASVPMEELLPPREKSSRKAKEKLEQKKKETKSKRKKKKMEYSDESDSDEEFATLSSSSEPEERDYDSDKDPVWTPFAQDFPSKNSDDEGAQRKLKQRKRLISPPGSSGKRGRRASSAGTGAHSSASTPPRPHSPAKPLALSEDTLDFLSDDEDIPHLYQKGMFVIDRRDMSNYDSFPIWKIDAGKLLQKYENIMREGKMLHKSLSTYSSWTDNIRERYKAIHVEWVQRSKDRDHDLVEVAEEYKPKPVDDSLEENPAMQDFNVYIQILISQALEPGFLGAIMNEEDDYYTKPSEVVTSILAEKKKIIAQKVKWTANLQESVEKYPFLSTGIQEEPTSPDVPKPLLKPVQLSGTPYCRDTLEDLPQDTSGDGDSPTRTSKIIPESMSMTRKRGGPIKVQGEHSLFFRRKTHEFLIGHITAKYIVTYHKLHHFKYTLYKRCKSKVCLLRGSGSKDQSDILDHCLQNRAWVHRLFRNFEKLLQQADTSLTANPAGGATSSAGSKQSAQNTATS